MGEKKDWQFYFEGLKSNGCFCGSHKKSMHAFCISCYKGLPKEIQKDLYLRIGDGYEEAYEDAVAHLT